MLDGYSYMWDLSIVILAVKYHWKLLEYHWLNMIRFGFSYIIWGFKFCLACQWVVELLSMYHLSFRFTACVDGSDFSSLIIMEFLTCRTFGVIVNLASWNFSHNEELKEREHIYIKLQCQEGTYLHKITTSRRKAWCLLSNSYWFLPPVFQAIEKGKENEKKS